MSAALDLSTVRRFTADLNDKLTRCDNGEGMVCASLDERINYYVETCGELREYVNRWARAIFTGELPFESETEALLKAQVQRVLHRAKEVAALGRAMTGKCFELRGLNALHYFVADFDYLLQNWVSPRRSVSPAPRLKRPDAVRQQIINRLEQLPPPPSDWRPSDPKQQALFNKQRGEGTE